MIERHVTFHLHPGRAKDFEGFFRSQYGPALARQPGFVGAELMVPEGVADTLLLLLRFKDAESAQSWRDSPDHKALSPTLKSMYLQSEVRVHQVLAQQPGPVGLL